ncbi:MAG: glycoside hydrolase family 15 protein [Thermoplasmata archaeon]|nr:glycoside hydrolase family 15 protein [Thermoplasmata archaeon]
MTAAPAEARVVPEPRFWPINHYGAIGNLHTVALVSPMASIDWVCLPRFASASVFARLLDPVRGGHHVIVPDEPSTASQSYLRSTNVLVTRFALPGNRTLAVTDFMPITPARAPEGLSMIVRIVEAEGGRIPFHSVCAPRFAYGAETPAWTPTAAAPWIARGSSAAISCLHPGTVSVLGDNLVGRADVAPDEPTAVEIVWGENRPTREGPWQLLGRTVRFWENWVHSSEAPFHATAAAFHRPVERSELALKLLSHEDTGAFVAAATTSLPEWIGGERNWDYRYVWIRDATFTAQAFLLLGHRSEAEAFLGWVLQRLNSVGPHGLLRVLYGAHGESDLTERVLPHLSGYMDSRPVRIGNAAEDQFQLDIYGELLAGAHELATLDPTFVAQYWPALRQVTEAVTHLWKEPDRGIWEVRSAPQHYVHSKLMAWVAFDRAADLARQFEGSSAAERWGAQASEVRTAILEHGYDHRRETFVQAFGSPHLDSANLRIPALGFLPYDDLRIVGTVHQIERELGPAPYLRRYLAAPDGVIGADGTFLPCGFWLVDCLARMGEQERAVAYWRVLLQCAGPLGLLSEEYEPVQGIALGNYPQALSHIALLRAALALGGAPLPGSGPTSDHSPRTTPWVR